MEVMRAVVVSGLNQMLMVDRKGAEAFTGSVRLSGSSPYAEHKCAYKKDGGVYLTRLCLLGIICNNKPIVTVYKGDAIQRFE